MRCSTSPKSKPASSALTSTDYSVENVVQTLRSATDHSQRPKTRLSNLTYVAKVSRPAQGDEHRITQVLLNLVGNAIKFTDTGEVRITVTKKMVHSQSPLRTRDRETGWRAKRIFKQFHQVDNSNTKAKGGTGLVSPSPTNRGDARRSHLG